MRMFRITGIPQRVTWFGDAAATAAVNTCLMDGWLSVRDSWALRDGPPGNAPVQVFFECLYQQSLPFNWRKVERSSWSGVQQMDLGMTPATGHFVIASALGWVGGQADGSIPRNRFDHWRDAWFLPDTLVQAQNIWLRSRTAINAEPDIAPDDRIYLTALTTMKLVASGWTFAMLPGLAAMNALARTRLAAAFYRVYQPNSVAMRELNNFLSITLTALGAPAAFIPAPIGVAPFNTPMGKARIR